MRPEFERLQEAVGTFEESKRDLNRAMRECFPIGRTVGYTHGENVIYVKVTGHSLDDRISVHNEQTSRNYWVSFYRMLGRA